MWHDSLSMGQFLAHYRLTPDEYNKFALTMIEEDKLQLQGIKHIPAEVNHELQDALIEDGRNQERDSKTR